jgi:flagellar hook protein FlgE
VGGALPNLSQLEVHGGATPASWQGNLDMANQTMYFYLPATVAPLNPQYQVGQQRAMLSWYPTAVSNNGYPLMVANFTSVEQAHTVGSPLGKDHLIEMDFGITVPHLSTPWRNDYPLGAARTPTGGGPAAPGVPNPMVPDTWGNYGGLAGIAGQAIIGPDHCRLTGAASSSTMLSRQNGYTYGNLMDIYFDQKGVMNGIYSNGVTLPLYQIVLYDFVAPQHLRFEGGNLISETRGSGEPSWGAAGVNGFGTINGYMIEQSNVDLAKEMVHMITTQRGFQANSKVITTVDIMLDTVVNMKR